MLAWLRDRPTVLTIRAGNLVNPPGTGGNTETNNSPTGQRRMIMEQLTFSNTTAINGGTVASDTLIRVGKVYPCVGGYTQAAGQVNLAVAFDPRGDCWYALYEGGANWTALSDEDGDYDDFEALGGLDDSDETLSQRLRAGATIATNWADRIRALDYDNDGLADCAEWLTHRATLVLEAAETAEEIEESDKLNEAVPGDDGRHPDYPHLVMGYLEDHHGSYLFTIKGQEGDLLIEEDTAREAFGLRYADQWGYISDEYLDLFRFDDDDE